MSACKFPRLLWLRRILFFLALLGALGFLAIFATSRVEPLVRSPRVAAWAIDQIFPGLRLELRDLGWEGLNGVRLEGIRLTEKKTGEVLAEVEKLRVTWTPAGLWQNRLDSIEITEPFLRLTPATLAALQPEKKPPEPAQSPAAGADWLRWQVGEIRCDYGQFLLQGLGRGPQSELVLSSRFSLAWTDVNFSAEEESRRQEVLLWGLAANHPEEAPLLSVDWLQVHFSPGILRQKGWLDAIEVKGGELQLGPEIQALLPPPPGEAQPTTGEGMRIWVGRLGLQNIAVRLIGAAPLGAEIAFSLNTTLQNIPLGQLPQILGEETQLVKLARIELRSPLDPLVRVITIHSVFVYFTLDGLLQHRLRRVVVLNPVMYLSQDLFIYMEQMRATSPPDAPSPQLDWVIEEFRAEYGSLILGGEKLGQVGLPLSFSTSATNVRLDSLASLRLRADLEIRTQDFAFPALQLDLRQLGGELKFSYPSEEDLNNLVNVLRLERLQWRQFTAQSLWLSATFDARGIFAQAGGEAYGGYVNAGVSFFFVPEGRWVGWVAGQGIDLQKLTQVLAPENFSMTGPAEFTIEVDGVKKLIQRLRGQLGTTQPGLLRINKIDDLLANLPTKWSSLKRSSAILALETLRDFRYTSAMADFWYVEEQGQLRLRMPGPAGSRNFTLRLHADETADGLWKLDPP